MGGGDWITVGGQLRQKVHETPITTNKILGVVVYTCHPPYMGSINRRTAAINVRTYLKNI
jgi:hypothetical protein